MIEFVEYRDERIRIKLPKQLRLRRGTSYFFSGILKRGRKDAFVTLTVVLDPPPVLRKAARQGILRALPHQEWMGVEIRLIRKGRCFFGDGGIEVLDASTVPEPTGTITLYRWNVLYQLGKHYVDIQLGGGGDLDEFEKMAKEIITSLKLLSPSQSKKRLDASTGSMIKSFKQGGIKAKEKARLASTLKSLPRDLKYLRDPILAIADEDQDLLGCGEVDTTLLAEALEKQAASQPKGFATKHSRELKKWLKNNTSKNDTWARPVWFVMAFLVGYDAYKDEDVGLTAQSLEKIVKHFLDAAPKL
jgi:hypothetical protein